MALLNTEANFRESFYRLVGTTTSDDALVENGESSNEVADLCITQGLRQAQLFLIGCGMSWRWVKRSSAIAWLGADATDGGQYVALPTDLLKLKGDADRSPIVTADGEQWGTLLDADDSDRTGDYVYLKNGRLYKTRGAAPPATVYIEYHFRHPEFTSGVTLDFDEDQTGLAVAYAAEMASLEPWFEGGADGRSAIARSREYWENKASKAARRSRAVRRMTPPRHIGQWFT